jgi:hypothetical protein
MATVRRRLLGTPVHECRYWPNPQPKKADDWCAQHPERQQSNESCLPDRNDLAAYAMQGMLAAESEENGVYVNLGNLANRSYAVADAMLAERAKEVGRG